MQGLGKKKIRSVEHFDAKQRLCDVEPESPVWKENSAFQSTLICVCMHPEADYRSYVPEDKAVSMLQHNSTELWNKQLQRDFL